MSMPTVEINFIAVLLAAVASMALGFFWYSPAGFGTTWMKLSGLNKKKLKAAQKKGMGKTMFAAFITTVVMAYVLAYFIALLGATTAGAGMKVAFWLWLGFLATSQLGTVLWDGKPLKLYYINTAHYLVGLLVMGAILAVL